MFVGEYKDQTVVALPYAGDRFTMYLVLPHNVRYSPLYICIIPYDFLLKLYKENIVKRALAFVKRIIYHMIDMPL